MNIRKAIIQVTVLYDADEISTEELAQIDLSDLAELTDSGPLIGSGGLISSVEVPYSNLKSELLAVGNDGSFFDEDLTE